MEHELGSRFQSSPSLSEGRYITGLAEILPATSFNPRPPFRKGATCTGHRDRVAMCLFQSSPSLSEGRYGIMRRIQDALGTFQSSPSLSEGRYPIRPGRPAAHQSFNPRPPFRKGATDEDEGLLRHAHVSILALPFGRALRGGYSPAPPKTAFQSSPSLSEGRYWRDRSTTR